MFNLSLGSLLAAALVFLFTTEALAQAAPADPFTKTPAFPTACYTEKDPFPARIDAAYNALVAETEKQKEINAKIKEEHQNIDPMEMASRMQQWMMSNPQEAMKYMQGVQTVGEESQTVMPELQAAKNKFEQEARDFGARYQAALKNAYAPAEGKIAALHKKLADANDCGIHDGLCSAPDWAEEEYLTYLKEQNAAYQATCPQWWGATGEAHSYLKRYREWLATKHVPYWTQQDQVNLTQYAIMSTPAASWRSTVAQESVADYMNTARGLFGQRADKPICTTRECIGKGL